MYLKIFHFLLFSLCATSNATLRAQEYYRRLDSLRIHALTHLMKQEERGISTGDSVFKIADWYWRERDQINHVLGIRPIIGAKPVDSLVQNRLIQFVQQEHFRFLLQMHPAYQQLDTITRQSLLHLSYDTTFNPLEGLYPYTKGGRYRPKFVIKRSQIMNTLNNLYEVRIEHYFYGFEGKEWADREGRVSERNTFAVFYAPDFDDIRILGGPAFLKQLPAESYLPQGQDYECVRIMAYARTINALGSHALGSRHQIAGTYFWDRGVRGDSLFTALYNRKEHPEDDCMGLNLKIYKYFRIQLDNQRPLKSCEAGCSNVLIKVPMPCIYEIRYEIMRSHLPDIVTLLAPATPFDSLQLIYYSNEPSLVNSDHSQEVIAQFFKFEKAYPYYEIKQTYYNNPLRYEDTLIKVRGITLGEIEYVQKGQEKEFVFEFY
jgi:hypothetical protein